jgi:hypothetical protein
VEFARIDAGLFAEARHARIVGQEKIEDGRQNFRFVRPRAEIGRRNPRKGLPLSTER